MAGLNTLHALSNMYGAPLTPEVAKPFLDLEREKNRNLQLRAYAAPVGALAMNLPTLPASMAPDAVMPGTGHVAPSSLLLHHLGMGTQHLADPTSIYSVAGVLPAMALTSVLGMAGSIGLSAGLGKLMSWLSRKREERGLRQMSQTGF